MDTRKRKRRKKSRKAVLISILYILIGIGAFFVVVYASEFVLRERNGTRPSDPTPTVDPFPTAPPIDPDEEGDTIEAILYFTNEQFTELVGERRKVANDEKLLETVLRALLQGPESAHLYSPIPSTVTLNGVFAERGTVYTDLSREMIEDQMGGTSQEFLSVFAIVNTLTGFSGVDRVKILIDGKEEMTLRGHIDISEPLERDEKIIAEIQ